MPDEYGGIVQPPINAPGAADQQVGITPGTTYVTSLIILQETVTGFSGIFGYSPTAGLGNLIFSLSAVGGTDPFGNTYPAGLNANLAPGVVTAGTIADGALDGLSASMLTINSGTISASDVIVSADQGGIFIYSTGGTITQVISAAGAGSLVVPAGVTAMDVELWGAGGGGGGNGGASFHISGAAGGGGQYAKWASYAVTPGATVSYVVGTRGTGGASGSNGTNGTSTTFDAGALSVDHGDGGQGGSGNNAGGAGGSGTPPGSPTATHNGGAGGDGKQSSDETGGGGGGGSGGSGAAGHAGADGVIGSRGNGASAVANGGPGGDGGGAFTSPFAGQAPTVGPGGGGGGGGGDGGGARAGGNGKSGQIVLTYTSATPALLGSWVGVDRTDPEAGGPVSAGLTLYTTGTPTTPTAGCVIWYDGTNLNAKGTTGVTKIIATT